MIQKRAQLVQALNLSVLPFSFLRVARALAAAWLLLIASSTGVAANSRTLHPSTTLAQQAADCVELIENGGFEIAGSGWTPVAGSSLFSYATSTSASGRQSLLLGFADSFTIAATFAVEQSVTLPEESNHIELSFYYDARLEGAASSGDQTGFAIYDTATNEPVTTVALAPSTNDSWSMERHDLTSLAGSEIRLVFVTQNDDEPGQLAMFVDDVSILACESSSTLPSLDEPTAPSSASPQMTPLLPQVETPQAAFPQTGTIDSLNDCSCASSLYACSDFSTWSVAQACYTHCQVTAGFDIHGLDEDNNGIACELELVDVVPLTATAPSSLPPQLTPSSLDESSTLTPSEPPAATPTVGRLNILPPATTTTAATTTDVVTPAAGATVVEVETESVTETVTTTAIMTEAEILTRTEVVTPAEPATVAIAPAAPAEGAVTPASTVTSSEAAASTSSPVATLSTLLFSPLGFFMLGILLVVGLLSLAVAYLAGRRRPSSTK